MTRRKKVQSRSTRSWFKTLRRLNWRRTTEVVVGSLFVIVIVYLALFAVQVQTGQTRTVDRPELMIRMELVDASGVSGVVRDVRAALGRPIDRNLEIEIVDASPFTLRTVPETILVARDRTDGAVERLAEELGLDKSAIVYRSLEQNNRQVSATLILGEDAEIVTNRLKTLRE